MRTFSTILVTGGCGFIGANFIQMMFNDKKFKGNIVNIDSLTYAGNPENLAGIVKKSQGRYIFINEDIRHKKALFNIFKEYEIDAIVHFAAESHVDRSIDGPADFIETNVNGTFNLLEAARDSWDNFDNKLFHHISTDEVFGSLGDEGFFLEDTPYDPRSPYSSSKAASDHLVKAWFHTYGLPITMTNCSNNYGPYQFPEKLLPLMILNMLEGKPLPVYGDGKNIRDWLFAEDHCTAIWQVMQNGTLGETYNVGGENEWQNIDLIHKLCAEVAKQTGKEKQALLNLITYVKDRPGHDRRYAINCDKIKNELGWKQSVTFEEGLKQTVQWYLNNTEWIESIKTGAYRNWLDQNYKNR